jgi:hypothetical protein
MDSQRKAGVIKSLSVLLVEMLRIGGFLGFAYEPVNHDTSLYVADPSVVKPPAVFALFGQEYITKLEFRKM